MLQLISFEICEMVGAWPAGVENQVGPIPLGLQLSDGFRIWISLEELVSGRDEFVDNLFISPFPVSCY